MNTLNKARLHEQVLEWIKASDESLTPAAANCTEAVLYTVLNFLGDACAEIAVYDFPEEFREVMEHIAYLIQQSMEQR